MKSVYCFDCGSKINLGESVTCIANVCGKIGTGGEISFTKKDVSIHVYLCDRCHFIRSKQ